MKTYFLDTSVIIDYLRGKEEQVTLINELKGKLVSSYICLSELYEGIFRSKNKNAESTILEFFSGLSKTYGLNQKIAQEFGSLRKNLKQRGEIIEDLDIMIAATCLVYNLSLVTLNKRHFSRVKGLDIV
ncbi:MAG: putative ribonuclease VapC [Candidatus Levybacteria bacterium GW2011_GWA2_37_36]|uniref:Putative ribonuclease VapC n=1 Tax=Candidatus Roizmanbacteria bacterium GW2011_GWC2_34_23 TaxID=1618484 RepID=A0A0G0BCW3_9BACT|nr:MAG: putative ribonuclease VapC [Candidatus Roizmanbacteria bacterium GW2011_GWC2_34_23]KKQ32895.1 MAG: putative ribonuclease VapC [Candidatus Levybacteria bacterium GW2011_GWA2_37_36]